jgi:hypothetical protein
MTESDLLRRFLLSYQPLNTISGRSSGYAGVGRDRFLELFWKSPRPSVDDWQDDIYPKTLERNGNFTFADVRLRAGVHDRKLAAS